MTLLFLVEDPEQNLHLPLLLGRVFNPRYLPSSTDGFLFNFITLLRSIPVSLYHVGINHSVGRRYTQRNSCGQSASIASFLLFCSVNRDGRLAGISEVHSENLQVAKTPNIQLLTPQVSMTIGIRNLTHWMSNKKSPSCFFRSKPS